MSWISASDTQLMSASQQLRVHVAESCIINPSYDQISQAVAAAAGASGGNSVSSVADVSGDTVATLSNLISVLNNFYIITVNPVDGVPVGQLRADVTNALQILSQTAGLSCGNFSVGLIEYNDGTGVLGGFKLPISTSLPLSIAFLAVIAVAVLIFVKVR